MTSYIAPVALFCLVSGSSLSTPGAAFSLRQLAERTAIETAKETPQKPRTTAARSATGKATATSPKVASTTKAKAADKPGKRFWARIMGCFREVHSVEKKTNK